MKNTEEKNYKDEGLLTMLFHFTHFFRGKDKSYKGKKMLFPFTEFSHLLDSYLCI